MVENLITLTKLLLDKSKYFFRLANIHFHVLANILLFVGTLRSCIATFPGKEGKMQVLAGLAPSSQTVGSLLRTSRLAKPVGKMVELSLFLKTCKRIFLSLELD